MLKSLFSKESLSILKNKKLIIAITAVIFIPILYAGMFLWAFWDPYAFLDDIPIAVVNEDKGYTYEGEYLTIGDELIDNLKDEADFEFHFVNKAEGYQGLQAQDYYILIEIPKDFSKNATTVMDDPQKLELIYVPNESFNFLAAQMGETAMLQIQQALQEKITETYADTIFEKIDDVAIQLVDASDATEELNDGAHELKDGSKKVKDNLNKLADKTGNFSDGVDTAYKGTEDLSDGASTLSTGIAELYDNSEKLRNASEDLQSGASQLESGMNEANDKVQQIQNNIREKVFGTIEVTGGEEFPNELSQQLSKKISSEIGDASESLHVKTNVIIDEIASGILVKLDDDIANDVAKGIVNQTNEMINNAPNKISVATTKQLNKENISNITEKKNSIIAILEDADVSGDIIEQVASELIPEQNNIEKMIQQELEATLNESLTELPQQIESIIKEKIKERAKAGIEKAAVEANNQVDVAFDKFDKLLSEDITPGLEREINQVLTEPIKHLQTGVNAINELAEGSTKLVAGQKDYVENMNKFTNSFTRANDGATDLSSGSIDLLTGMFTLKDGALQLNDGAIQLADGSNELYDGMISLVDGTEEFNEKMHEAAGEANDVNTTDDTNHMIASPVKVENEKINEVPNYGTGFAPYFLSLGLFVGALLLSIVYPLRETSSAPTNGTEWFLRKFLVLFSIGVFQALIASGILLLGLGIEVQSIPRFIMYAIITSLTFITLIQFFVTCFDDPGRFIAIIILILQLTTSAGTFPLELIPRVLQPLNAVLPMTYSVAGFKVVISSGDYGVMWQNVSILLGFSTIFIVLTWAFFIISYQRINKSNDVEEALQQ